MPAKPCSICTHPRRDAIDLAIAGGGSQRATATHFQVGRGPLARHVKDHLPATARAAAQAALDAHGEDVYRAAQDLNAKTLAILDDALAAGEGGSFGRRKKQPELALRAIREARANLELIARLQGDLEDGAPVEVVVVYDDEWRTGTD